MKKPGITHLKLLLLVLVSALFAHKYYDGMLSDAVIYAAIAKNMAFSGDFIVPSLTEHYYSKFFDHPPLFFWVLAIFFKIFGVSTFVARLFPMLCGAGLILGVYFFTRRRFGDGAGIFSVFALVLNGMFLKYSASAMIDVPLTLLIFGYWWVYVRSVEEEKWRLQLGLGLFLGAGLLMKGPIVLGVVVTVGLYALIFRKFRSIFNIYFWLQIVTAAAICCIWLVPLYYKDWNTFYNDYVVAQLKATLFGERGAYGRGFVDYNVLLLKTMTIWLIPFVYGVWQAFKSGKKNPVLMSALVSFAVFYLPFVVLNIRRIPHYLVYILPFFSVLAGWGVSELKIERFKTGFVKLVYGVLVLYTVAILILPINVRGARNIEIFFFGDVIQQFEIKEEWDYFLLVDSYSMWNFHPLNKFYFDKDSLSVHPDQLKGVLGLEKLAFAVISREKMGDLADGPKYYLVAECKGTLLISNREFTKQTLKCGYKSRVIQGR